jgi:hypothetical protein
MTLDKGWIPLGKIVGITEKKRVPPAATDDQGQGETDADAQPQHQAALRGQLDQLVGSGKGAGAVMAPQRRKRADGQCSPDRGEGTDQQERP